MNKLQNMAVNIVNANTPKLMSMEKLMVPFEKFGKIFPKA